MTTEKETSSFTPVVAHLPNFLMSLQAHTTSTPLTTKLFGVVMFADISGFTALCESYTKPDEKGMCSTDQLTTCLNDYLGHIIEGILKGGGDILKFAGDALLALWLCQKSQLSQVVPSVLQTSLDIQTQCNGYKTDKGVQLRLKIGLAAGAMDSFVVGGSEARQFAVIGQAIDDVNQAQSLASIGSVTVSWTALEACTELSYSGRVLKNGYMQVNKVSTQPVQRTDRDSVLNTLLPPLSELRSHTCGSFLTPPGNITDLTYLSNSTAQGILVQRQSQAMNLTLKEQETLKTYLPKAVVSKLNDSQSLAWLSEMRIVSILFINVNLDMKTDVHIIMEQLQLVFTVIHKTVTRLNGSVNKLFMFDKGCTFLAIFGLPGEKHENDATRALRSARQIFIHLKEREMNCSIGVTTGRTFCGVVGHPTRHEFTVIGSRVNMAARLMMAFPGCVTCDESTMNSSGVSHKLFKSVVPDRPLKGIEDAGSLYAYNTEIHHELFFTSLVTNTAVEDNDAEVQQAINTLGRTQEMQRFDEELSKLTKYHEEEWRDPTCVVVEGGLGMGKTRVLDAFKAKCRDKDFRVVCGHANQVEQHTPFYAVKTLVARLLELERCHSAHEREQVIISKVSDSLKPNLPLLNELLGINLPHSPRTQRITSEEHTDMLHSLLFSIVHHVVLAKPCVFFVDDAQWIDVDSWTFLYDLASDGSALLVLAMRPFSPSAGPPVEAEKILRHPHTIYMKLGTLDDHEMIELARLVLGVSRIPKELEQLTARCHGVPLFCEELVASMLRHGQLTIISVEQFELQNQKRGSTRSARSQLGSLRVAGTSFQVTPAGTSRSVCVVPPGVDLSGVSVPSSVKEMVLTRIDGQSHGNRQVMKCAAVLGVVFTRPMLAGMAPHQSSQDLSQSIDELVQSGIFECAVAASSKKLVDPAMLSEEDDDKLCCHCMTSEKHDNRMPCSVLRFTHTYLQETSYGLMVTEQRKYLHKKAAELLEAQAHKCRYCGGGDFMEGSDDHCHSLQVQQVFVRQLACAPIGLQGEPRQRAFVGQVGAKRVQRNRRFSARLSISSNFAPSNSGHSLSSESLNQNEQSLDLELKQLHQKMPEDRANLNPPSPTASRSSFGEPDIEDLREVDLTHCECAEVLSHVYPQLVRHYEAAGFKQKLLLYLVEAGAAAVQTSANLEAVAHLKHAKRILEGSKEWIQSHLQSSMEEQARIESLLGQALFQMGHSEECMPHFYEALRILNKQQPSKSRSVRVWRTAVEALKQVMHLKFPGHFKRRANAEQSHRLLEQARCLAHVAHAYHLNHDNLGTVMAALQQLNVAEEAQENIHRLLDAYSVMIECCQHFRLRRLGRTYEKTALDLCEGARLTADDLISMAHFYCVTLNMHLAYGDIRRAIQSGKVAMQIAAKLHDVKIPMIVLPLYFHALLAEKNADEYDQALTQLRDCWRTEDEKIAGAWYFACCLELCFYAGSSYETVEACAAFADDFCHDILAVDAVPDAAFYLASLVALWYAQKDSWSNAMFWLDLSHDLQPDTYEAFISTKALCNVIKCRLLYLSCNRRDTNVSLADIQQDLRLLKKLCKQLPVFKSKRLELTRLLHEVKKVSSQRNRLDGPSESRRRICKYLSCLWCRLRRGVAVEPSPLDGGVGAGSGEELAGKT